MTDLTCRCMGSDKRTPCEEQATQEDGLCDSCRTANGKCCEDSPSWQDLYRDWLRQQGRL